jgi:hypothetical protein
MSIRKEIHLSNIERVTLGSEAAMVLLGVVLPGSCKSSVAKPRMSASLGSGVCDW